ncbi:carbon-nitrogen hydrolase family protein [Lysinibacter cavernae]|uniref:Putative amidohydrolase n=1 Tax=Lysinibacter cavernae TaxID=1640652 RepID=A0A7X5QYA5_9MICO|nr:carbon-nitrogen hydrolase family protein [Lysinibacter cavernae]NIH52244.1 putative amidohydrolase [Lysinibacter cavernae]
MSTLDVAVVQFNPTDNWAENLVTVERYATEAAGAGAQFVVFPEYSSVFTKRLGQHTVDTAQPVDGPFVTGLQAIAAALGIHLVAGIVEALDPEDEPNRCANTLIAIDPTGKLVATYRKLHLYDAFGQRESDWVAPGAIEDAPVFDVGGCTVGLQTCYDIRFPEVSRWLVDAGATLLVVPAEWVAGDLKTTHWQTLLAARAIENTVFVAAADHAPPVAVGHSAIIDPRGVTLASLADEEGIASATLETQTLEEVRTVNPALSLRRFEVAPRGKA